MSASRRRPSGTDLWVALGCGVVTVGAFAAAPTLLGPEDAPTPSVAAWWTTVGVLVAQALLLVAARVVPGTAVLSIAGAAMLLGLAAPSGLANLADAAVIVVVLRTTSLLLPSRTFGSIEKSREPIRGPISLCGIYRHRIIVVQASHCCELDDDCVLGSLCSLVCASRQTLQP